MAGNMFPVKEQVPMPRKRASSPELVALGARLRAARERAGLSQAHVDESIGLKRGANYTSSVERGQVNPGSTRLRELAKLYGVTIDALTATERPPSEGARDGNMSPERRTEFGIRVFEAIREAYGRSGMQPNADDLRSAAMRGTELVVRSLTMGHEPSDVELQELAERIAALHHDAIHLVSAPAVARTRERPRSRTGSE